MGLLAKGLLLYFCMAIAVSFWQPSVIFGDDNGKNMLSVFGIDSYNSTTNKPIVPDSLTAGNSTNFDQLTKQGTEGSSTGFLALVDGLLNVLGFIGLLLSFLFSPFIIFAHFLKIGAPIEMLFVFALPIIFMVLIAFIHFIGGRQE
jgi:hypothetical protein